ncbi:MAG: 50S ribosomal protein L35 [Candidatus Omnitrophota bacterium]|nr:50S ribosomal protein L35 [Candidatus Omnitrophota bacterium]
MPKLKTRKSVAKRFKLTKRGKIKRSHAYRGHILSKKSRSRKRGLRKSTLVHARDIGKIIKHLPYGNK